MRNWIIGVTVTVWFDNKVASFISCQFVGCRANSRVAWTSRLVFVRRYSRSVIPIQSLRLRLHRWIRVNEYIGLESPLFVRRKPETLKVANLSLIDRRDYVWCILNAWFCQIASLLPLWSNFPECSIKSWRENRWSHPLHCDCTYTVV